MGVGGKKLIRCELKKLLKMRVIVIPLLFLFGYMIYSMVTNGEFGYDYADNMLIVAEKDGNVIQGQSAYEHNKEIAQKYTGKIDESLLAKIHNDYENTYNQKKIQVYDSTLYFFDRVFKISNSKYLAVDDVWKDRTVQYGFTGDWDAYNSILGDFFAIFGLCVVAFAAPIFTNEKECHMTQQLCIAKKGGDKLLWNKIKMLFLVVNTFMIGMLTLVSVIHFAKYGFANANVSIQSSPERTYVKSLLSCTVGQLALYKIVIGCVGCNALLCVATLISIVADSSLNSFMASFAGNWLFCYSVVHFVVNDKRVDTILALHPVNMSSDFLIKIMTSWNSVWLMQSLRFLVILIIVYVMIKIWRTKSFYRSTN